MLIAALLFFFAAGQPSFAEIKVSPGAFCIQNVDVGKDLDLGMDLIISNISDQENAFSIKPLSAGKVRSDWLKGYFQMPDPAWLSFEQDKITVGPNAEGKVRMHINIPGEEKYLNQHWIVFVDVTTEALEGAASRSLPVFRAAISANYMIETRVNPDVKERPDGILGLVPSAIEAKGVIPGKKFKGAFKIYNNDKGEHDYTVYSYVPQASQKKQDISVTPGYEFVKDKNWVKPVKGKIKIKPGSSKTVNINIALPDGDKSADKGWEGILFVQKLVPQ